MSLAIREIQPASSVNDVALIPNFSEESEQSVLAVAQGNKLNVYQIGTISSSNPNSYEFYDEVKMVCPIQHPSSTNSNILIIFANFRACILRPDGQSQRNFSIVNSTDIFLPMKIQYAAHPNAIAIQTASHHIDIFAITENNSMEYNTAVSIGCRNIIGFCFVGPTSKVVRLAVLTEEFQTSPILRTIDIDLENRNFIEDMTKSVDLPLGSYYMFPLHSEVLSTVIILTSQSCLRVSYKKLAPKVIRATILTPDKIVHCTHFRNDIHSFVDEAGNLGFVEINKKGNVHFESSNIFQSPFKIVPLSHNLLYVASRERASLLIKIKKDNTLKVLKKFENTGMVKKVVKNGNELMAVCQKANIKIRPFENIGVIEKVEFFGGICLFTNKNNVVVSKSNETIEIGSKGRTINDSIYNIEQKTLFLNSKVHCTENELRVRNKNNDIIADSFRFCISSTNYIVYVNSKNVLTLSSIQNDEEGDFSLAPIQIEGKNDFLQNDIICLTLNNDFLAIMTSYIAVYKLPSMKLLKTYDFPNTVSMKFSNHGELITCDASDFVRIHSLDSLNSARIYCEGTHSKICEGTNNIYFICGSKPVLLTNSNTVIPINCDSFYDAVNIGPNEFACLNFESIQKIHFFEKVYMNEWSISTVPLTSFVRLNENQVVYSRTIKDKTYFFLNDEPKPFYACQNFICIDKANTTLNIICTNNVIMFDKGLKKINDIKFDDTILNLVVNHSRRYLYTKSYIVDLESNSFLFNTGDKQEISFVSLNDHYTVVIINEDTMVLYAKNDDNSYRLAEMIPIYENITCISLNRDMVLVGTKSCKLLLFQIIDKSNLKIINALNFLVAQPSSIDKIGNYFLVGLTSGKILEIKIVNLEAKFERFLGILHKNIKCIAGLCKLDQFLSEQAKYQYQNVIVFDISVLARFASMREYEQKHAIDKSEISLEDARKFVSKYNKLFLS